MEYFKASPVFFFTCIRASELPSGPALEWRVPWTSLCGSIFGKPT